jgi:hypothetical protein
MLIPIEKLIDGVIETLRESVLPDVGSRFARGQLFAAVDVLQNMRDRVEEKAVIAQAEVASIENALGQLTPMLEEAGEMALAGRVSQLMQQDGEAPPAERAKALRDGFVSLFAHIAALPPDLAESAGAILGQHLAGQVVREVLVLKPSLLREISEG